MEYEEQGYFWVVRVLPDAVDTPVQLQLYDPAFVYSGQMCSDSDLMPRVDNSDNPYAPDANLDDPATANDSIGRYERSTSTTPNRFCSGDLRTMASGGRLDTSFALLEQTDTLNPNLAPPVTGCTKQFRGFPVRVSNDRWFQEDRSEYDEDLARVFHQWVDLCTFTPTRAGDYYLQVRSNVALGGTAEDNNGRTAVIYADNPDVTEEAATQLTGEGNNAFGIRAVTTPVSLGTAVSVAGWERMPIFANAPGASSEFNLIRVIPAAAGKSISFEFFDVGDASEDGSVQVLRPLDATGSITSTSTLQNCMGLNGPDTGALPDCTVTIEQGGSSSSHNGKVQTIYVPIPGDYNCNETSQGGCWFRAKVSFPGATVNDITTWDADVRGDPVRLIE